MTESTSSSCSPRGPGPTARNTHTVYCALVAGSPKPGAGRPDVVANFQSSAWIPVGSRRRSTDDPTVGVTQPSAGVGWHPADGVHSRQGPHTTGVSWHPPPASHVRPAQSELPQSVPAGFGGCWHVTAASHWSKVQRLPSSGHAAPADLATCWQPPLASQVSAVHELPSSGQLVPLA